MKTDLVRGTGLDGGEANTPPTAASSHYSSPLTFHSFIIQQRNNLITRVSLGIVISHLAMYHGYQNGYSYVLHPICINSCVSC